MRAGSEAGSREQSRPWDVSIYTGGKMLFWVIIKSNFKCAVLDR